MRFCIRKTIAVILRKGNFSVTLFFDTHIIWRKKKTEVTYVRNVW